MKKCKKAIEELIVEMKRKRNMDQPSNGFRRRYYEIINIIFWYIITSKMCEINYFYISKDYNTVFCLVRVEFIKIT